MSKTPPWHFTHDTSSTAAGDFNTRYLYHHERVIVVFNAHRRRDWHASDDKGLQELCDYLNITEEPS